MRRYLYLVVAASIASLVTAMTVGTASAAGAVLQAGGADLAVGATISGSATSATINPSSGGHINCTGSTFTVSVVTNPAAGGTATGNLTNQTFSGCTTSGVFGVPNGSAVDITVTNLPRSASITNATDGVVISSVAVQSVVHASSDITCNYSGSPSGTPDNLNNALIFSGETFTRTSGGFICPSSNTLVVTYHPVTSGGNAVTVN